MTIKWLSAFGAVGQRNDRRYCVFARGSILATRRPQPVSTTVTVAKFRVIVTAIGKAASEV